MPEFNEEVIEKLFGREAAEDEEPKRLREYYFKNTAYQQVISDTSPRILVGHKGIGKSALFTVAIAEGIEQGKLTISIQPSDIDELLSDEKNDLNRLIATWAKGLGEIIIQKVINFLGISSREYLNEFQRDNESILEYLKRILPSLYDKIQPDKKIFITYFLEQEKISIYIDDLDRGWKGRPIDVTRISALLNAVRDLSRRNRGLFFKLSLRSDVFYLVRTSDESTDKIEGSVIWHTWTNHEIYVLLIKRIETFFGRDISEDAFLKKSQRDLSVYLHTIMEDTFTGRGLWLNTPMYKILMSLIRKRPRDLIKLCTLAAKKSFARKSEIIQTEDFKSIFEEYSQGRIQDTINEYRSELPNIQGLIMNMKPNKKEREARKGYVYTTDELFKKIGDIMESQSFLFSDNQTATKQKLATFLYKINFLTARRDVGESIVRKYFEENRYLSSDFVDFGFDWEVHPAYRWALQPTNIDEIYNSLKLSEFED